MILDQNKIFQIGSKCLIDSLNKKRKCHVLGCDEIAINSHIIWKNGVLKLIAEDGHLYQLNPQESYYFNNFKFKKISLKKILTFYGFCNKHDNSIFKEIESDQNNYNTDNQKILLSVRSVYFEKVKKEQLIDYLECLKKERIVAPEQFDGHIHMQKLGIKDLKYYLSELNSQYHKGTPKFHFKTFDLPKLPVACSGIFQVDGLQTMAMENRTNPNWQNEPLNYLIFNIIPNTDSTQVILGYHLNFLQNLKITYNIDQLNTDQKVQLISNILIERLESWVCSPSFYKDHLEIIEDKIIADFDKQQTDFTGNLNKDLINIFKDYQLD